mmetsp:Transcript_19613/g.24733  ORF Transcript_19613/g.24733 Transcript_19613/m.24733 type:complete len:341 (-) Transcript_19613:211-1233(-)
MVTKQMRPPPQTRRVRISNILASVVLLGFFYFLFNITTSRLAQDINAAQQQFIAPQRTGKPPEVLPDDLIYKSARTVFVIPEYKLIFFTFPKVACSEWKRMFMRINGNQNWCKIRGFDAHDPKNNKILTLSDYPTEIATAMMTSPKWTRAAIVREPKERVLSAFLDKAVKEHYYVKHCCEKIPDEDDKKTCIDNEKDFKSFITFVNKYPKECFDVHWEAQVAKIDSKWWSYIDFVGHQDNLVEDAKTLLKFLTSTKDDVPGRSAWERYGAKGWGNDNELCEKRPNAFLVENSSTHKLDTGSRLMEWYTPETEKLVEKYWSVEWEQKVADFPKITLFPDEN